VAGNEGVGGVAEEFGDGLQQECYGPPWALELFQDREDGVGTGQ